MTARDDLEIFSLGKTSLCHKGPFKNSTTSCNRSIPLANIYLLVIRVSLRLLMFTLTYPGFILPFTHMYPHIPPHLPTFTKRYPHFTQFIYVYLPHLIPRLPTFTPSYLHFIPFINILFCLYTFTHSNPCLTPFPNLPQVTHLSSRLSMFTPIYLTVYTHSINGGHPIYQCQVCLPFVTHI